MNNVLYVCPSSDIGGAETVIKQTWTKGDRDKQKNHYFLFRSGPLYDFLIEQGAKVVLLKKPPRLSKWSDHQQVTKELIDTINRFNIHILHSTMAYGALFSARAAKKMNIPHVWFQHGPASGWMDRLAAIMPHSGLVVNSHFTGKKQRELENPVRFLIPRRHPIEKILLGTDLKPPPSSEVDEFKSELYKKWNIPKEALLVAMLCRIQSWKGVHILLEAIGRLKSEISEQPELKKIQVVIWGEAYKNSIYLDELKSLVQKENLPVIFAGSTKNVALCLSTSHIVVNASTQPEPFGLSIVEGMMMGAIPVVPNEGGPMEIVENGRSGLLFESRDHNSLARQLKAIALDPSLQKSLKEGALQAAHQKYDAQRAITQLETFHNQVLTQFKQH